MKLHITKGLLTALILSAGLVHAENKVLTGQETAGSGTVNKYLERVTEVQEWSGSGSDILNYSNNSIKYTTTGNCHAVLSLHKDNYNNGIMPDLTISGYKDVSFDSNSVETAAALQGTAIHLEGTANKNFGNTCWTVTNNGTVSFNDNTGTTTQNQGHGGAVYVGGNSSATITNNAKVSFERNSVTAKKYAHGGAIRVTTGTTNAYNGKASDLTISNNTDVSFIGNKAEVTDGSWAQGGAIYSTEDTSVDINGNTGKVEFIGNGVKGVNYTKGGAIYSKKASTTYAPDSNYLSIRGNHEVLFQGNYEIDTKADTYRLRSIYSEKELKLSANEGGKIEFKDSIYVGTSLSLNENYDGKEQTGTIIFSGKTVENDLNNLIAANTAEGEEARQASKTEIDNSRTSVVSGTITLNAGTLSLQDGAILQATKVIIAAGATLEITATSRVESEVLFLFGDASTDSLVETTLDADLYMKENSVLKLSDTTFNMNGNDLIIEDNVTFLCEDISAEGGSITLFGNVGSVKNSKGEAVEEITVNGFTVSVNNENGNVVVDVPSSVPEPTTATLSLLALAGLCARRRRK
ncbi:MAG: hypothetical protein IKJ29_05005 [Akkermansia sp.]|nr:hypothetical protein [Akkermansia sp.]